MAKFVLGLIVIAGIFGLIMLAEKGKEEEKKTGDRTIIRLASIIAGLILVYVLIRGCQDE